MGKAQTCCHALCRREGLLTLWVAVFCIKVDMGRCGTAEFGSKLSKNTLECIKIDASQYWGLAGVVSGLSNSTESMGDEKQSVMCLGSSACPRVKACESWKPKGIALQCVGPGIDGMGCYSFMYLPLYGNTFGLDILERP